MKKVLKEEDKLNREKVRDLQSLIKQVKNGELDYPIIEREEYHREQIEEKQKI